MKNSADSTPILTMMGVRFTEASLKQIFGNKVVIDDLCTRGGIRHDGAIMAFAFGGECRLKAASAECGA